MDNNKGSLILKALSPDADEAQVIAYLEKRAKSIPPEKIPPLLKSLPVVLSRNVPKETGMVVVHRLQELGAIALFLPDHEPQGNGRDADLVRAGDLARGRGASPPVQRFKQFNKELLIVLSMIGIAWMLNYSLASQYLLLGFYTLPAVVSAYLFGRRQAVFTAFAAILLVGLVSYFNPGSFNSMQSAGIGGDNQWYHIISWGCILLVTAYTMGTLYERNKNKMEELRQTYQGLLLILRHFIAQDEEQENHCFRVSIYATRIAFAMGLEKEEVEDIRSAALLHDIGHLKISRSILRKASRLNRLPGVLRGGEPVADNHLLSGPMGRILPMLIGQHAPSGQGGKEESAHPPVGASILAIADAYDLLTIGTDQQSPLSPQEAKAKILADADSGYDAEAIKAFAKAVDRMDLDLPSMLL